MFTGERVLCYHGQLIYEAKLLKTQVKDRTVKYYIHYAGWSKNWDEWVGETRVLKYNEENVQKQKEIQNKVETSSKNMKKTPKATSKKRFVIFCSDYDIMIRSLTNLIRKFLQI